MSVLCDDEFREEWFIGDTMENGNDVSNFLNGVRRALARLSRRVRSAQGDLR